MKNNLKNKEYMEKFDNPKAVWANLQWELHLAKNGFKTTKEYYDAKRKTKTM